MTFVDFDELELNVEKSYSPDTIDLVYRVDKRSVFCHRMSKDKALKLADRIITFFNRIGVPSISIDLK